MEETETVNDAGRTTQDALISVGRIVKSRGLHGEVVVHALSDDPERFKEFDEVLVAGEDSTSTTLKLAFVRTHPRQGKAEIHLRFEGVDSREQADTLRGYVLSVRREELKLDEDEYFLFDLTGLEVTTADGKAVGHVKEVQRLPGQDLIVVASADGQESLIPDVPEFVDKSLMDEGKLVLTPIEGLLTEI